MWSCLDSKPCYTGSAGGNEPVVDTLVCLSVQHQAFLLLSRVLCFLEEESIEMASGFMLELTHTLKRDVLLFSLRAE